MPRDEIEPTIEQCERFDDKSTRLTHPAYGQITVSKVSGSRVLYGSDFVHHSYVTLRIH